VRRQKPGEAGEIVGFEAALISRNRLQQFLVFGRCRRPGHNQRLGKMCGAQLR
jgi:hypothetical protein